MDRDPDDKNTEANELEDFADSLAELEKAWRTAARLFRSAGGIKRNAIRAWLAEEISEHIDDAAEARSLLLKTNGKP